MSNVIPIGPAPIPEEVDGPLVRPSGREFPNAPMFPAPSVNTCPDCRKRLNIVSVTMFSGTYCVARWLLMCGDGHRFEYDLGMNFTEEAYGDDEQGLRRAREQHAKHVADVEGRLP